MMVFGDRTWLDRALDRAAGYEWPEGVTAVRRAPH